MRTQMGHSQHSASPPERSSLHVRLLLKEPVTQDFVLFFIESVTREGSSWVMFVFPLSLLIYTNHVVPSLPAGMARYCRPCDARTFMNSMGLMI